MKSCCGLDPNGFTVPEQMLLLEDSDNYDLFSASDRDQFLFRVFKHVCLGGPVCQVK